LVTSTLRRRHKCLHVCRVKMRIPTAAGKVLSAAAGRPFHRVAHHRVAHATPAGIRTRRTFAATAVESAPPPPVYAPTGGVATRVRNENLSPHHVADVKRLARRLRLGDDWQVDVETTEGIASSYGQLVTGGRLQGNPTHAQAVAALAKLPPTLEPCRAARRLWDAEQAKLAAKAEAAEERLRKEKEEQESRQGFEKMKAKVLDRKAAERLELAEKAVQKAKWDLARLGPPPKLKPAGCYLYGPVGSGKSTMMDLMCLFGHHGYRLRRQHFHEFSLWLHELLSVKGRAEHFTDADGIQPDSQQILAHIADRAAEGVDILCLDEFAVTNVADAAIFKDLFKLLAERYVCIACTTNRPPEDLYQSGLHRDRYVPALVEHLRDSFEVVLVDGPDYRQEMLREDLSMSVEAEETSPVVFQGGDMESALRAALADEAGGVPELVPGSVKISWGRLMKVPLSGNGFACFHFDDLCRQPYGAEDYLCLALKYHTIFIHGIPRLTLEEHNEARRFTNFVDAVYEHSVKLICHSDVAIDDVLKSVEALREATGDGGHDADRLGVFEPMYDDSPNFQLQIQELGGRKKYNELRDRREAEQLRADAVRLGRMTAPEAAEGDTGSGWSVAPAAADLSAPQAGVAGVMVAAVGSLQESGFAARRAVSRLREMRTATYLQVAQERREAMV